ncbi:GNAT family N-acetyltransferase [Streptomyces purpurogeneiscleroticus]|uniref:GNAT family N-acetyltransferase n=1 Tax=Streptomyces purpurogeneiscleroticus TaxID=68259 RepID=UPI001CC0994F|nr:GNAT family N-acetyltransferase [Streptomyces purpurogeneiscleroticus]MBZ4019128.1 GNAT family N-acetyltransferase [Streptomyces purpurogeneiscleroticus]
MAIRTKTVPRAEIFDLRWSVLRPGLPAEAALYSEDADPGVFHMAAYDGDTLAACATFFPDPVPGEEAVPAYRFRGMASSPEARGRGFGAAVLRAGIEEAARRGAQRVWCNGRVSARGFYERMGFTTDGATFEIVPSGAHHRFVFKIATG